MSKNKKPKYLKNDKGEDTGIIDNSSLSPEMEAIVSDFQKVLDSQLKDKGFYNIGDLIKKVDQLIQKGLIDEESAYDLSIPELLYYLDKHNLLRKGKYKVAGHFKDQQLKYSYPGDNKLQLSIFDKLQDRTKKDIEVSGVDRSQIVEGIKLSPSETKVIDCLCKLLHKNSQILDKQRDDYYSGNVSYEMVNYAEIEETPAPKIAFTIYELTKEYKGGEYVSGKDIENVKQIIRDLDSKQFLLSYVETTKKKDGGRIERKIEDFRKLIKILKFSETDYSRENIELSKKEETVILLNPIFRRQIDSKFILYPEDINRRTIIAYGSHNVSDIALRLRDILIRELSSKHYKPEIGLERLYYQLAEKWMRESRRKKVRQYTDKAIETVKALGLLRSYEIKPSSSGGSKIVFTLNEDWE